MWNNLHFSPSITKFELPMHLQAPKGKVIVAVDIEGKNSHTFANGQTIRLERKYNNLNFREVNPVNATCLASEHIPAGAEVLIHHNSVHDVNRIFNLNQLSGETTSSTLRHYSLAESECFLWRTSEEEAWQPCPGFATALRVFKPYRGFIQGIEPTKLPDILYLTSGALRGQVCKMVKAADYEIVYQGRDGREDRVIRCRHFPDEINEREEVVAVMHELGEMVEKGELWVGLHPSDARPLNP
jgi:hypothetical protein